MPVIFVILCCFLCIKGSSIHVIDYFMQVADVWWWNRHSGSNQASHSMLDKMHFFLLLVKYCMWSWVVLLHRACTELNWKIKNHTYKMCVKRSIYNCLVIHQLNSPCLDSCLFFVMKQDSSRIDVLHSLRTKR